MAPAVASSPTADLQDARPQLAEPGSKFGVVLLTITFVFIAIMIIGDFMGFLFR